MLRLNSARPTLKIELVLDGAVTLAEPSFVASWNDVSVRGQSGGAAPGVGNGTTPVLMVEAPAIGYLRDVDYVSVVNRDTDVIVVTVQYKEGATAYPIIIVSLAVGDQLYYTNGNGWMVLKADGSIKSGVSGGGGGGGDALTTDPLSQFASTTSAQLASVISNETGSGFLVFATSPTLVTPVLGTPTSGALTNCTKDGTYGVGYLEIPQNSKSAAYTTVLADSGKHILHPAADTNDRTFTIDSNANVAYSIGTALTFVNEINTVTIAITADTLTLAGAGTTGSRTLAANGMATALKIASTKWVISGTGLT